jgi:hypothetical protein
MAVPAFDGMNYGY